MNEMYCDGPGCILGTAGQFFFWGGGLIRFLFMVSFVDVQYETMQLLTVWKILGFFQSF